MAYETVLLERRDSVAVLSLNRPDVRNALNRPMIRDLRAALEELEADAEIKAIVLRGKGRSFCSGDDLEEDFSDIVTASDTLRVIDNLQNITRALLGIPKPVIAAIHGHAIGAGCELAMNCDIRLAAADAKFAFTEARWGYTVTNAGTKLLPELIGLGRAKEMVFAAEKIDALTAERWGLVNHVVENDELETKAFELAARIAANSTLSIALMKRALNASGHMSYEEVLTQEVRDGAIVARSPETLERVAQWASKSAP